MNPSLADEASAALNGDDVVYVVCGPFDLGTAAVVAATIKGTFDGAPVEVEPWLRVGGDTVAK